MVNIIMLLLIVAYVMFDALFYAINIYCIHFKIDLLIINENFFDADNIQNILNKKKFPYLKIVYI